MFRLRSQFVKQEPGEEDFEPLRVELGQLVVVHPDDRHQPLWDLHANAVQVHRTRRKVFWAHEYLFRVLIRLLHPRV